MFSSRYNLLILIEHLDKYLILLKYNLQINRYVFTTWYSCQNYRRNQSKYIIKRYTSWAMDIQAYPAYPLTQPLGPKTSRIAALLFRTHSFPLRRKHKVHESTITQNYTGCSVLLWKRPILVPHCGIDYQKSNFSLIFGTF